MSLGTLLVATVGQAVIRSADDGKTWHRLGVGQAMEFDAITRSLAIDPVHHHTVYAGTDAGLCVSHNGGETWASVAAPFTGETVWKVAVDPRNNHRLFVGTGAPSRAALWRTLDRGKTWYRAPVDIPEFCAGVNRPRLLTIAFDPTDENTVWFGLEEGGLFVSNNGGDDFTRVDERLLWPFNSDVHNIVVLPNHGKKVVMVVCVNALYRSLDDGQTWSGIIGVDAFGLYYMRSLTAHHRSESTAYISIADGTPGTTSKILITQDAGETWQILPLPMQPNSCIWTINQHFADPNKLLIGTKYGHLFTSENGGNTWVKQWREFGEIADVLWSPAETEIKALHQSIIKK